MRKNKGKLSKRTLGLLVAAIALVGLTGGMGARAALTIQSQDYNAEFALDHIDVVLLENGEHAGVKDDATGTVKGKLLVHGHDKDGLSKGRVIPGKLYKEEIAAGNASDVPEYVRLTIRTYWIDSDGNKVTENDRIPAEIKLTYNGTDYNSSAWKHNEKEETAERKVYYLTEALPGYSGNAEDGFNPSAPLVNELRIGDEIVTGDGNFEVTPDEDGHVLYFAYKYNGYRVCIEADVQSIQTHNVYDAANGDGAARSLWGVDNVSVVDGKIQVN